MVRNAVSRAAKPTPFRLSAAKLAGGLLAAVFLLGATTCNAQFIFHKKKRLNKSTSADNNAQPDKILYDRAMDDVKHGREDAGRLNMQTLINTYPDSEYLAKAKLAIADSYYKEGGTANLALAVSAYKDFEVFFPFLPESTYAQMQVAMAHYRQMEKPDRDRSQALDAEAEFQTFLEKYPNDPLAPKAQQRLREVQEVLAEGDYRIGYFYYVKGDRRAAATRLLTVATRYPLYSRSDHVLWMMGDIFEKSEKKEIASLYYGRIVKDYPLSSLVPQAKDKLKAFGVPVPQPDPTALAWMTAEQNTPREHTSLIKKPLGILKSGPETEIIVAAKNGAPNLQPESDSLPGGELLTPGGKNSLGTPGNGVVATVVPGIPGSTPATGETVGGSGSPGPADPSSTASPASDAPKDPPAASTAAAASSSTSSPSATAPSSEASKSDGGAAADPKPDAPATDSSAPASADSAKSADDSSAAKDDSKTKDKKESSSKKKKGLRKIVPW